MKKALLSWSYNAKQLTSYIIIGALVFIIGALVFVPIYHFLINDSVDPIQIELYRFDQKFSLLDVDNLESQLIEWDENLDGLHIFYFSNYLGMDVLIDDNYKEDLVSFIINQDVINFNSEVFNKFENFDSSIFPEIEVAFGRMNHHLPSINIPKSIITVNSFQTYGMATLGDTLIIGLDMYLGKENKYYTSFEYENFMKQERFLIVDALENWITSSCHQFCNHENFLDELIFKGKVMYLVSIFQSQISAEDLLRFSEEDVLWCDSNEYNIWNEIIDQDLLYDSDWHSFNTFFSPGPFTNGLTQESPGRVGYWLGYKIIQNYMKNNDCLLSELIKNSNSQDILLKSKYKP